MSRQLQCDDLTASEFLLLLSGLENLERAEQALVDAHHGTSIVEFTTVVGGAEERHQLALGEELIAVLNNLMGTANEIHVMLLQESRHYVRTKGERDTSVVLAPSSDFLVRVRPEEIAKQTAVRDISRAHDTSDLLHRVQVRAETTVHGEDLLVDNSGDRKAVEAVSECLPELDVVSALALVVETIDTVDGGTLVVSSENEEVLRVLDLVCEQQADSLKRLLASVDVVTEEQVVGIGGEATIFKETEQIVVLSVNIAANLDGSLKLKQDGLRDENLTSLGAEVTDLGFEELNLLARATASHLEEPINYRVKIDLVLVCHLEKLPWGGTARRSRRG